MEAAFRQRGPLSSRHCGGMTEVRWATPCAPVPVAKITLPRRFVVIRAVIYSNPVDVMPERTYGTERYSAGQWEDRNRRVEVSGSAPQIPSGPNGPSGP